MSDNWTIRVIDYQEACKKIREQAKVLTKRMWKNLKPYIEKEKEIYKFLEGRTLTEEEIRSKLYPEWTALIDKDLNLISPRYGFDAEGLLFTKPIRTVSPKPYSIGDIHYHPIPKLEPSDRDLISWVNRYEIGEKLFCIHTDEETVCYLFRDISPDEIPQELKSFALALFGMPEAIIEKVKNWFRQMIEEGKVMVYKCR